MAGQYPAIVKDLENQHSADAKQPTMNEWLMSQVDFPGIQGTTVLAPEYAIDGGLSAETPTLPVK